MARQERPLAAEGGVVLSFAHALRRLRESAGRPTYRELSTKANFSVTALSQAASGQRFPSLAVTLAYVQACGGDRATWEAQWHQAAADLAIESDAELARGADGHAAGSAARVGGGSGDPRAPYVGLVAFEADDADLFFGRDAVVAELQERVRHRRLVAIVGPSGSGKSSVLRAGLVAAIRNGDDGPQDSVVVFSPGARPVQECAVHLAGPLNQPPGVLLTEFTADARNLHLSVRHALATNGSARELTIVVDQLEELFTLCTDREERTRFLDLLVAAASAPDSRARVVLGVRADFYRYLTEHPGLVAGLRDGHMVIGPMDTEGVRQAVTGPARSLGCQVETALVAHIVAEAAGQPGALPLISNALRETWSRRRGHTLTLTGFTAAGGITHALARTAEAVYLELDSPRRDIVRRIFQRLAAFDATDSPIGDTKRRLDRTELRASAAVGPTGTEHGIAAETATVLERLTKARLVVQDDKWVELAHEALIRHWPRLRRWLTDDRESLRVHRNLTEAAGAWTRHGQSPDALMRGSILDRLTDWARQHPEDLSKDEELFLHASQRAQLHTRQQARREHTRRRRLNALVVMVAALMVVTGVVAVLARTDADHQRDIAASQTALHDALEIGDTDPALSLQLMLAAYKLNPVKDTLDALVDAAQKPYAATIPESQQINSVAMSPVDRHLAIGIVDRTEFWDYANPLRPVRVATIAGAGPAKFSPDGHLLARWEGQGLSLWDVHDLHAPIRLSTSPPGPDPSLGDLAFSPDGRLIAVFHERLLDIWDVSRPANPKRTFTEDLSRNSSFRPPQPEAASLPARFRDGEAIAFLPARYPTLVVLDPFRNITDVMDIRNPHRLRLITTLRRPAAPAGLLTGSAAANRIGIAGGGVISLWDVTGHNRAHLHATIPSGSSTQNVYALSHDGRTLAMVISDTDIALFDVTTPEKPVQFATLTGHVTAVGAIEFSPDDKTLISTSGMTPGEPRPTVRLTPLGQMNRDGHGQITAIAVSATGRLAASINVDAAQQGDSIELLDTGNPHTATSVSTLPKAADGSFTSIAFTQDARTLIVRDFNGTTFLWDIIDVHRPILAGVISHRENGAVKTAQRNLAARSVTWSDVTLATSQDGRLLAIADHDTASVAVYDIHDPYHPHPLAHLDRSGEPVTFLPDGKLMTADHGSASYDLRTWDITRPETPIPGAGAAVSLAGNLRAAAIDPTGRLIATGEGGPLRLEEVGRSGAPDIDVAAVKTMTIDAVPTADFATFDSASQQLAIIDDVGTTHIMNISRPDRPVETVTIASDVGQLGTAAYNPETGELYTGGTGSTMRSWDTSIEAVTEHICLLAYPRLTAAEWNRHLPQSAYQPPCP